MRDEGEHNKPEGGLLTVVVVAVAAIASLVFAPLLLSLAEVMTLGTGHVYDFCVLLGIADTLTLIYDPVLRLFR